MRLRSTTLICGSGSGGQQQQCGVGDSGSGERGSEKLVGLEVGWQQHSGRRPPCAPPRPKLHCTAQAPHAEASSLLSPHNLTPHPPTQTPQKSTTCGPVRCVLLLPLPARTPSLPLLLPQPSPTCAIS